MNKTKAVGLTITITIFLVLGLLFIADEFGHAEEPVVVQGAVILEKEIISIDNKIELAPRKTINNITVLEKISLKNQFRSKLNSKTPLDMDEFELLKSLIADTLEGTHENFKSGDLNSILNN